MARVDSITLLNRSNSVGAATVENNLHIIADALDRQIKFHVAPAWQRLPMAVIANIEPRPGIFPIYLFDNADVAGALGYHDEDPNGFPYGRIFLDVILNNGGTWFDGSLSVSAVYSHEVCELFGDKDVNQWRSDLAGKLYAVELCDPVEEDNYKMDGTNVSVSNFIYDTWFDRNYKGSKFDHMGVLDAAFTMSRGGYYLWSFENRTQQQMADAIPEWRQKMKECPASRTYKRLGTHG